MGSFAYTCGVSHLPIHAGDDVRYILLSQSPYGRDEGCSANGHWFPRGFPIKAKYNDYGSVEDVEEGVGRDLWMEALKIDLVAVGVGDNSCHDVPTSKAMSFDELLTALVERRVQVRHDIGNTPKERKAFDKRVGIPARKTPKGVPTMQRVKAALKKAGFDISVGIHSKGYLVNKVRFGTVRVRWNGLAGDFGKDTERLTEVLPCLVEYAAIVKAGEGAYAHSADLLVHPKPGTENYHGTRSERPKPIAVEHLMIREDVWQGLLQMKGANAGLSQKDPSIEFHRKGIRDLYRKACKDYHKPLISLPPNAPAELVEAQQAIRDLRRIQLENTDWRNPLVFMTKDEVPFAVGFGTNWRLLIEKNLPEAEVEHVLDSIAEMAHVMKVLYPVRYQWEPSTSCGPQFGEWAKHVLVNKLFARIAENNIDEDDEDSDELAGSA